MSRILNRLRAACRTNEPQAGAVGFFTLVTLAGLLGANRPAWAWVLALAIWPLFAFIINLVRPLPTVSGRG